MKDKCPNCGQMTLSRNNPFGLLTCESCYWVQQVENSHNYRPLVLIFAKWGGIAFVLLAFVLLCMQFILWGKYSFDATYLIAKQYLKLSDEKDDLELGAICNSLGNHDCSIKYFLQAVESNPRSKKALANLGINYAKKSQWELAKRHMEAYFSLGGNGYDVMLWYGHTLNVLEGELVGMDWSYLALAAKSDYTEAGQALIKQLLKLKRYSEAQSVVGGMVEGNPEQGTQWHEELQMISQTLKDSNWAYDGELEEIRLPKVRGRHFYIPVSLRNRRPIQLFTVDKTVEDLWIHEDYVFANQIEVPVDSPVRTVTWEGEELHGKEIQLEQYYIGPWKFEKIKAMVCSQCPFIFGEKPLGRISTRIWNRHQTEFLSVKELTKEEADNSLKKSKRGKAPVPSKKTKSKIELQDGHFNSSPPPSKKDGRAKSEEEIIGPPVEGGSAKKYQMGHGDK